MRKSNWTPSIVPNGNDQTVYLVADDFGKIGRSWREADYEATDLETIIQDLLSGEYRNPLRVIAFNTAERWSEDVSEDNASNEQSGEGPTCEDSRPCCQYGPVSVGVGITAALDPTRLL